MIPVRTRSLFAAALFPLAAPAQDSALQQALDRAAAAGKQAVVVAVTMPFTRGSHELRDHLQARAFAPWLRHVEVVQHEQRHGDDGALAADLRARLLEGSGRELFAAPQLLVSGLDGVLRVAAYGALTAGQVEWSVAAALDPKAAQLPAATGARRAPEFVSWDRPFAWTSRQAPPSEEQMAGLLRGAERASTVLRLPQQGLHLARSNDAIAWRVYKGTLDLCNDESRVDFLERIAQLSPGAWHEVLTPWLGRGAGSSRAAAADALAALRHPEAARELKQALRKQKDPRAERAVLRALVACDPADRQVAKLLHKVLTSSRSEVADAANAVAAGVALEDRERATELFTEALAHERAMVRSAAAYAIAMRRDVAMRGAVEAAVAAERDGGVRTCLKAALAAIDERGSMGAFSVLRKQLELE